MRMENLRTQSHRSHEFAVDDVLHKVAHYLPTQGPLRTFVHHNTLHAFQNMKFHAAIKEAAKIHGAKRYLSVATYLKLLADAKISSSSLAKVLARWQVSPDVFSAALAKDPNSTIETRPRVALRELRNQQFQFTIDGLLSTTAIRLIGSYVDQGVSVLPFPVTHNGLWHDVKRLKRSSFVKFRPLNQPACSELLDLNSNNAIPKALEWLVGDPKLYERYVTELLLHYRGWSGLVYQLEQDKTLLVDERKISLMDWLALLLTLEVGFCEQEYGTKHVPLAVYALEADPETTINAGTIDIIPILHEAWEETAYAELLTQLNVGKKFGSKKSQQGPKMQAIFCIDDREFTFRRFLEASDSAIETYGAPGFFGVDCLLKTDESTDLVKHCPVPVTPKFVVHKVHDQKTKTSVLRRVLRGGTGASSFWRGWIFVQFAGIPSGIRLLLGVLNPRWAEERKLAAEFHRSKLVVFRDAERTSPDDKGLFAGYTFDEAAAKVAGLLRMIGLTANFADMIAVVAHGASSVNNPYFSAYDCGACSGRPGGINSRAFAMMANHPEVRSRLLALGINIPSTTQFVPMLHDTTASEIEPLVEPSELAPVRNLFERFHQAVQNALDLDAEERCKLFELAPQANRAAKRRHVHDRAIAWYEPRPEYNHAANFACVVGRRDLSREAVASRGVFLQSYDPHSDPDGTILQGILNAVIPVCGGINLEYMFSRFDTEIYGAGTKLPQNVVGLVGVMTGLESDLRTGLPTQMTEIHDPLRLVCIVEQKTPLILTTLNRIPAIKEWLDNDWVNFVAVCPDTGKCERYRDGKFVEEVW